MWTAADRNHSRSLLVILAIPCSFPLPQPSEAHFTLLYRKPTILASWFFHFSSSSRKRPPNNPPKLTTVVLVLFFSSQQQLKHLHTDLNSRLEESLHIISEKVPFNDTSRYCGDNFAAIKDDKRRKWKRDASNLILHGLTC